MRAIVPILLLCSGCAAGVHESSPAPQGELASASADPSRVEWTIQIETGDRGLGAYTLLLRWNAEVASIAEIVPARPPAFKGAPESNPATFKTGQTKVGAFQAFGSKSPGGPIRLFTVIFARRAPGRLSARVTIEKLYDDDNRPVPGTLAEPDFQATFP